MIVDLAVPRNVEPDVDKIRQVYLRDIDDLDGIVEQHRQERLEQAEHCEKILDEEMDVFDQWLADFKVKPLISQMYADAHDLRDAELEWFFKRCPDLTTDQRGRVVQLVERISDKLMHPCVSTVRRHRISGATSMLAETLHAVTAKIRRK